MNVYLIEGGEPTLIDAGPNTEEACESPLEGLQRLSTTAAQIRHILITHVHADHYGLAGRIGADSGALVWAHHKAPGI